MAVAFANAAGGGPLMQPALTQPPLPLPTSEPALVHAAYHHPSGTAALLPESSQQEIIAIGIDLGCDRMRVAVWSAEEGVPVECCAPVPSVVAWRNAASSGLVGDAALHAPAPLLGLVRILGRKYSTLGGAKWLEAEAEAQIGCSLLPSDEADGAVRVKLVLPRPQPSGLKKRGGGGGGSGKPRSATVDKLLAGEQIIYKLLLEAKSAAEALLEAEVTHAVVAVPACWGCAARRSAYDCCVLANLTPLAACSVAHRLGRVAAPSPNTTLVSHSLSVIVLTGL
uniref:Uncharacterized protein n=1 Tax=Calcidiscus leptoporus TaxID=127549 RepID=A0A7S0IQ38_9EUKA|mmetsp:Transcript_16814/g.38551  ORF Transcript_16814/g.38551 Transcript_16814/m.38551 type:complete len:282 (+) Transcript_16814:255-1100(+)